MENDDQWTFESVAEEEENSEFSYSGGSVTFRSASESSYSLVQQDSLPHEEDSHSDEEDADWANAVKGAREFWNKIKKEKATEYKKLKYVKKAFEKLFENDGYRHEFPSTWKLIVHTLRLDPAGSGDQMVTPENFRQMLSFFGPPTADEQGCIKTAGDLCTKSQRIQKGTNKSSWFAGIMDQGKAQEVLQDKQPGTFLVRFSSSQAEKGWFALAITTESAGVVQFQIEQNQTPARRCFKISGQEIEFGSIWELVQYFELNPLLDEQEVVEEYLQAPCPDLPLNAICSGYKKGGRKK